MALLPLWRLHRQKQCWPSPGESPTAFLHGRQKEKSKHIAGLRRRDTWIHLDMEAFSARLRLCTAALGNSCREFQPSAGPVPTYSLEAPPGVS